MILLYIHKSLIFSVKGLTIPEFGIVYVKSTFNDKIHTVFEEMLMSEIKTLN